jgi:hypothetical protein
MNEAHRSSEHRQAAGAAETAEVRRVATRLRASGQPIRKSTASQRGSALRTGRVDQRIGSKIKNLNARSAATRRRDQVDVVWLRVPGQRW